MLISKFGGLNTNLAPYLLPEGKAQACFDVRNREGTLGKRPGMVRKNTAAGTSDPLALWTHVDESANVTRMVLANGSSRYLTAGAMTAITGGNFGTGPFKFGTLRGVTVIAGTTKFSAFKDTTYFGDACPTAPGAGAATSGTGSLASGTYTYWFVRYSTQLASYGGGIGTSFSFTSTGTAPSIALNGVTTDTLWDKIQTFRSTVGGATPLAVGSPLASGGFPFNDTTADGSLGSALSPTDATSVADAIDLVIRDDRVFLIRSNDRAVYHSESGKVSLFSALGFLTSLGGREVPVALAATLASIYVFGRSSIWLIAGNTSTTYSMAKVVDGIGCTHRNSVQVINDRIYFRGELGFYEFDGINPPVLISLDIDDLARGFSHSAYTAMDTQRGEYKVFIPGTYGHNDVVYSYDVYAKEWWPDRYPARCGAMMRSVADSTASVLVTCDRFSFYAEHSDDVAYDQISSGTTSGTAGAGSTTSSVVTTGLYTTGDGLKGCIVEIETTTGSYERREVLSNSGTSITPSENFSSSPASDAFVINGITGSWTSGRVGKGTMMRFMYWEAHFEEQTAGTLEVAFAVDAGGFVDSTQARSMGSTVVWAKGWVGHHGRRVAVRVECRGHAKPFALASLEIDAEEHES